MSPRPRRAHSRLLAPGLLGLLLLLAASSQGTASADAPRRLRLLQETEHFLVGGWSDEVAAGTVTDTMATETAAWLEAGWSTYVEFVGLEAPKPRRRGKLVAVIADATGTPLDRAMGFYRPSQHVLWLHARRFDALGEGPAAGQRLMKHTVPHELFHAIQHGYDPGEDAWLKEASAAWAATEVFSDVLKCVVNERRLLRFPEGSPHVAVRQAEGIYDVAQGRPYGASLFLRFLATHGGQGAGLLRTLWDRCRATPGAHGLAAVSQALGDEAALGPRFRAQYERYVVGCVLLEQAPADSRLPDADRFAGGRAAVKNVSDAFARYVSRQLREGARAAPLSGFAALGGLGTRYWAMRMPTGLPPGSGIRVTVTAAELAAGVQALAHRGSGWEVLRGTFDPKQGAHVVTVPRADGLVRPLVVAVTRYAESTAVESIPVRIELAKDERWVPDLEDAAKQLKAQFVRKGMKPEEMEFPLLLALAIFKELYVDLAADGTFRLGVLSDRASGVDGTWTASGADVTLTVTGVRGELEAKVGDAILFRAQGDARVMARDGMEVRFVRAP